MATKYLSTRFRQLAEFRDWKDAELARLSHEMTELRLPPGRVIEREGSYQRQFVIIMDGQVSVQIGRICVATLRSGDTVGLGTVLRPGASMTTATADTETTIFVATVQEFHSLLDSSSSFGRFVAESAVRANKHLEHVLHAWTEGWRGPALDELFAVEPAYLMPVPQGVA
jgi:CRP-like cAMP-binding protein